MANTSLEGLTLHVSNLKQSLEFYKKIPGAQVVFESMGMFALLKIGKGRLGLLQFNPGQFHVEIESNDLDATYEALRAAGIEPEGPPSVKPWGERDFAVKDPDGFMLEFGATHETAEHPVAR